MHVPTGGLYICAPFGVFPAANLLDVARDRFLPLTFFAGRFAVTLPAAFDFVLDGFATLAKEDEALIWHSGIRRYGPTPVFTGYTGQPHSTHRAVTSTCAAFPPSLAG